MRTVAPTSGDLIGRRAEIGRISDLLAAGRGGVLVLRGEAGIGKSSLLAHAREAAHGFAVIDASGSQFETRAPFAALHHLCAPVLRHLDRIPDGYRTALRVAFGQLDGEPDVFRAGLAALELLTSAAGDRPLLCTVDDAQWLDPASVRALALLARRISAEHLVLLMAVRTPGSPAEFDELPGVTVAGLSDAEARALLTARGRATLDGQVRDRLVAEARGNPLALRELPAAGGFAAPATGSVPGRIEREYRDRLSRLAPGARLLLTVASADPTGDPGLLWPAARTLGVPVDAVETAETAGLVTAGTRIRFCHPLARSAVYRAASGEERRRAHRALAEVTDPVADPDRRVWHRAQAATAPDDALADELERMASRARARAGVVAAAAFVERAASLTRDPRQRARRTLAAVGAHIECGHTDEAEALLTTVGGSTVDPRVDQLRGRIAFVRHHDGDGPAHMLRAARLLAATDPRASRECLLDALEMSLAVGRSTGVMDGVLDVARSAELTPSTQDRDPDALDALAVLTTDGHRAAAPLLRRALDGAGSPLWTQRPALAVMIASELWDIHAHAAIVGWLLTTGHESGSPMLLRLGLAQSASHAAVVGDVPRAMAAIAEEEAIADAVGWPPMLYPRLHLAAVRGRRDEAVGLFATATAVATARGAGQLVANVHWAAAVFHNSVADYPAALAAARAAVDLDDLFLSGMALPELVEAAVRCRDRRTAGWALTHLAERTGPSGTDVGLGITAYARGLVTGSEDAYREAVDRLDGSPMLPYRARAHLLYGEWLRREGRRRDCRRHLGTAHDLLADARLEAFAQRAATELRAAGEQVHAPAVRAFDRLTMQELSIARLVATGATSAEVATRLFISPRTVDAHLRSIFRKLGITSRRQLRDRVPADGWDKA
jgi:DNA-binding CsgD family transcriptional regulator